VTQIINTTNNVNVELHLDASKLL